MSSNLTASAKMSKSVKQNYREVAKELARLGDKKRAEVSAWFFKTGKGQYGEGDKFLGITVPVQRKVAHKFGSLAFPDIKNLLDSKIHEHRFVALEILVKRYEEGGAGERARIVKFYLSNAKRVNNWDLVDTSAPYILGDYLLGRNRKILYKLVRSHNIWERRIAIVATYAFIKRGELEDTFKIAELLLQDKEDLIRKSAGWMLREAGKRSRASLESFLLKHTLNMPRTMLRYAIEKFPKAVRQRYLEIKIVKPTR